MTSLPLPSGVSRLAQFQQNPFVINEKCNNLGLLYHKFLSIDEDAYKVDAKEDLLSLSEKKLPEEYKHWLKKRQKDFKATKICQKFRCSTRSRMICGVGNSSVTEVGIAFHPLYGFPVIPGSSLKGLAWHYFSEKYGKTKNSVIETLLFGYHTDPDNVQDKEKLQEGCLIFYDAWPAYTKEQFLYLDVMTPHFQDYYGTEGRNNPGGSFHPIPIPFLTVRANTLFHFWLSLVPGYLQRLQHSLPISTWKETCLDMQSLCTKLRFNLNEIQKLNSKNLDVKLVSETLLSMGISILQKALKNWGIGAKTGSGYGYMELVKAESGENQ